MQEKQNELKKQNFLAGAMIIAIMNIIVKVIGALFKIPLNRILEEGGMGIYTASYTIYNLLFVVATAGLPVAISRMVSESITKQNYKEVHAIYKTASRLLLIVGIVGGLILLLGGGIFAKAVGSESSALAIRALAPCLFFVAIMSVYRGMFQGTGNMVPTAISEFIEAVGKLVLGLVLAYTFLPMGKKYGAAGAILGVSAGAMLGAVYLVMQYRKTSKTLKEKAAQQSDSIPVKTKSLRKRLLRLAIPITIGSAVFTLASFIDLAMIMNQLKGLGFGLEEREELWGLYSGHAVTLFNLPPTIITALSISIVPAVTSAITANQPLKARATIETAIRITSLIALPCAIGMSVLSEPILQVVMGKGDAASMLTVLAIGVIFVTVVMVSNAILQSYGKVWKPVMHMLIGGAVKVIVNFVLVGNRDINIQGAPYGTVLCYITVAALNLVSLHKLARPNYGLGFVIKTGIATAAMGVVAYFAYGGLEPKLGTTLALAVAICAAAFCYLVLLLVLRALKRQDMEMMPGSKYIIKYIGRFL